VPNWREEVSHGAKECEWGAGADGILIVAAMIVVDMASHVNQSRA